MLIAGAELTAAYISVPLGALWHAVLILVLVGHYIRSAHPAHSKMREVLPVLALLPLIRVVSVAMPLDVVHQLYWHAWIGVPLLLAVGILSSSLKRPWTNVGTGRRILLLQAAMATCGLPLGLLAYYLLRPAPLKPELTWLDIVLGSLILVIFSALLEEVIFRGMLLPIALHFFGTVGILWSGFLFAIMYIGTLSVPMGILMFGIGSIFGLYVQRTGSIWGAVCAHSVFKVGLILIFPAIL